jgi:hypothetical protein
MATVASRTTNGSGDERAREAETERRGPRRAGGRGFQRDGADLMRTVEEVSATASRAIREQLDQRPYVTLGAGLLAGYVLGGGLSLRLAALLMSAAGRATVAQLVARGVSDMARGGGK